MNCARNSCRVADRRFINKAAACNASVKQRKGVSHSSVRNAGNQARRAVGKLNIFFFGNIKQPRRYILGCNAFKIKTLASGKNC